MQLVGAPVASAAPTTAATAVGNFRAALYAVCISVTALTCPLAAHSLADAAPVAIALHSLPTSAMASVQGDLPLPIKSHGEDRSLEQFPSSTLGTQPPSAEAQSLLRKSFTAAQAGLPSADALLTQSINEWQRTRQPADELAAIYKSRAIVRQQAGRLEEALADLSKSLALGQSSDATDPAEVQRTFALRAGVEQSLGKWKAAEEDLSAAIDRLDDLDALEATNPYLYAKRAAMRMRIADYAGAAEDAERAELDFRAIGDKIQRVLSAAEGALALYGADRVPEAVEKMKFTFRSKGVPASNNPDDIGLLQELSRRDAELHLAYAAHLLATENRVVDATAQWRSGCIRLEAYRRDAIARQKEEAELRRQEAAAADAAGRNEVLRANTVRTPFNGNLNAQLNGMDPNSPYVTQRPGQSYYWYKFSEGDIERRDAGNELAVVDESLSCSAFRDEEWLRQNRPEWPPELVKHVKAFAQVVPDSPLIMPPKGAPPSRGEVEF